MTIVGSLKSTRFGTSRPPRDVTSEVTRSGDLVEVSMADGTTVVLASFDNDGRVKIRIEAEGRIVHAFDLPSRISRNE